MCVDLFSPGNAITIEFLHERVYIATQHNRLSATLEVDAFIRNDNPNGERIDSLRLQFPHFIDSKSPGGIEIGSIVPFMQSHHEPGRQREWFGTFQQINDDLIRYEPDYLDTKTFDARILEATIAQVGESSLFEQLDATVLDLRLQRHISDTPLGWLHLTLRPKLWPGNSITPLPALEFLRDPHEFLARISIVSPGLLRHDLERRAHQTSPGLIGQVVDNGWRKPNTLTRVLDHRITLVIDSAVQIMQLTTTTKDRPVVTPEPFPIEETQATTPMFGQTFLTGSRHNQQFDVVRMANRICNYIATRPVENASTHPVPISVDELMTRFGGSYQEAVGTFVKELHQVGILINTPASPKLLIPSDGRQRRQGFIDLRRKYTFFDGVIPKDKHLYEEFKDLHPFHISFTARWTAFTERQLERMKTLTSLADLGPIKFGFAEPQLTFQPRMAVIVACSHYTDSERWPRLEAVPRLAKRLCGALRSVGQFERVELVLNPRSEKEIAGCVSDVLRTMKGTKGQFLFWFIGHGKPSSAQELELVVVNTEEHGIPWKRLCDSLRMPGIQGAAVLDCCFSGAARIDGFTVPEGFCLWCSATAHEPAPLLDENGVLQCVTDSAASLLVNGFDNGDTTISFRDLFNRVKRDFPAMPDHVDKTGGRVPDADIAVNVWGRCSQCGPARDLLLAQIVNG